MKKLGLLLIMCMVSIVTFAQYIAEYYVTGDIKAQPGENVLLSVKMRNNCNIRGLQMHLYLPEGVTVAKNGKKNLISYDEERAYYHSMGIMTTKTGATQIDLGAEDGDTPFEGNDGDILYITLAVAADAQLGTQNIRIANIVFDNKDSGKTLKQDDVYVPMKIYKNYTLSAASSNETMGAATLTQSGAVENGTSVTATATPVAGYEFVNWTVGEEVKSTESTYEFTAAEDLALTANFKPRKFDVTFDVDGNETTNSLDYASVITAPAAPTKPGYTFAGWSPAFVEGATVPVDGITYKATWTINQYTITFDTDGGSEVAAITQNYATDVAAPANPIKTGYTFKGWDKVIPATIPAENVTIKAQWQINQYTITFDTDGGSEVAAITQNYATDVAAPANPTKTGYTFKGWDKEIPATIPAENVTIKAQWQINQYTVKFVSDEKTLKTETLDYNSAIAAPADPTKTGYTFKGWSPAYEEGATVPAEDVTYTAVWDVNKYTITFDTDGGSEVATITQDYASAVTAPADPTKTGYTFAGWDKEIPATVPAEDVTIKATWTINQYTVKFVSGETIVSEQSLDYGAAIAAPEAPAKEGYTFKGWSPEVAETVPADDVTYVAEYTVNTYKLTYVLDGQEIKTIEVEYGSEIEDFVPEVETGRVFDGWTDEIPETMPAKDLTINGKTSIDTFIRAHFAVSKESVEVYTINGTHVMTLNKADDINRLTRGTYIINGRKVVIRK